MRSNVIFSLIAFLLGLSLTVPAQAMDWRTERVVSVGATESVQDDLYAAAATINIDGVVNGDLIAFGQTITVSGSVNGNIFAAAQTVIINGKVTGTVRAAANVIYVGEKARIERDLVGVSAAIEIRKGSVIGRDLTYAGAESTLSGAVNRNVRIASAGIQINGSIKGNLKAEVSEHEMAATPPARFMFFSNAIDINRVSTGIEIAKDARIGGNLEYSQSKDVAFPQGTILGKVTRTAPVNFSTAPNAWHTVGRYAAGTLALLFIAWLILLIFPRSSDIMAKLRERPGHSFLWGCVAFVSFIAAVIIVTLLSILLAAIFGLLTLHAVSVALVLIGILGDLALIFSFLFMVVFGANIIVGMTLGEWILQKAHSPLAEHRFWPMLIGIPILMFVLMLLSLPAVPGFIVGLLKFAILLFALGALWLHCKQHKSADA